MICNIFAEMSNVGATFLLSIAGAGGAILPIIVSNVFSRKKDKVDIDEKIKNITASQLDQINERMKIYEENACYRTSCKERVK